MVRISHIALVALACGLFFVAGHPPASGAANPATRVVLPALASDSSPVATRPYRMGWFFQPPEPTVQSVLKALPVAAGYSDALLIQREAPWERLLAGDSMQTIAQEDYDGVITYARALGLHVSILVDPLDGLDRTREGNEMRAAGRSLNEPEMRALHEQWVEFLAARYQPDYFGLASEINSLAARGDSILFQNIQAMCNRLAPRIRTLSPNTRVFVSFQVDEAWRRIPQLPSKIDHFVLTRAFDIDVLGLSTYPSFFFDDPSQIPLDYFSRLADASGKPVLIAEGGWSSDPTGQGETAASRAGQKAFMERFFTLLDTVQPELVILLLFADLNLDAWIPVAPSNSDPERVRPFTHMGLANSNLEPKPALSVWSGRFKRPFFRD